MKPFIVPGKEPTGTTHGSPWSYDTRVPLLWFGAGIAPGTHAGTVSMADVAPTLAFLLGISQPGGSKGRVLSEMLSQK